MKRHTWVMQTLLALMVLAGVKLADAGVIYPVSPTTGQPDRNAAVTISLFNQFGGDITDTWLPTWEPATGGPTIYIGFNFQGTPAAAIVSLKADVPLPATLDGLTNPFVKAPSATVPLLVLATSRYPGPCTNVGSATDPGYADPDYVLNATAESRVAGGVQRDLFALTSQDCGGIAVIRATVNGQPYLFTVPQDSNLNGIPDIWESRFCPGNSCPVGNEDADVGPVLGSPTPTGDGIAAFDEYRGFIVSGHHVSTDPRQRDLFVRLVNPQCGDPANSLLGGGTTTFPDDGSTAFDNLVSLVPGSQIHLLEYNPGHTNTAPLATNPEWVDRFVSFSQQTGFLYSNGLGSTTPTPPADDRRINANAVFPLGTANPTLGGGAIHRGLRITECLEPGTDPLGTTGLGSPDGPDNSLVYTQRIVNYIDGLIAASTKPLKVFAFEGGAWVPKTKADGTVDRNFVISQALKFYVAHELAHSTRLTPTPEGTNKVTYGYHHAPGTGSVMDQTIVQKIDSKSNAFYIPSLYNGNDQSSYKTRD